MEVGGCARWLPWLVAREARLGGLRERTRNSASCHHARRMGAAVRIGVLGILTVASVLLLGSIPAEGGDKGGRPLAEQPLVLDDDARVALLLGCERGDARGCTHLGVLHSEGLGRPTDYDEAARLYGLGCDGGDGWGCTNLGFLHGQGIGRPTNYGEAGRLYRLACDGGQADGCSYLGELYERGRGRPKDSTEARELYRRGCEGGSEFGCKGLSRLDGG